MAEPEQPEAEADDMLSAEQVAKWLGISEKTVRRLRALGELPACKIGRTLRWEPSVVRRFIDERTG